MRARLLATSLAILAPSANAADPAPSVEQVRGEVREWVETMRQLQQEETEWKRDKEVLEAYRDGLRKELEDLRQDLERAKTRKQGGDKESLDKIAERDRFAAGQTLLATKLPALEAALEAKLPLLPQSVRAQPKVVVAIEALNTARRLPADKQDSDLSKRLFNLVELIAEFEKCHQQVVVQTELHKDPQGREFKMRMVYFGLAMAYGVNEDGSFAVTGRPAADGWKFKESNALAPRIRALADSAENEKSDTFTQLPLAQP